MKISAVELINSIGVGTGKGVTVFYDKLKYDISIPDNDNGIVRIKIIGKRVVYNVPMSNVATSNVRDGYTKRDADKIRSIYGGELVEIKEED